MSRLPRIVFSYGGVRAVMAKDGQVVFERDLGRDAMGEKRWWTIQDFGGKDAVTLVKGMDLAARRRRKAAAKRRSKR